MPCKLDYLMYDLNWKGNNRPLCLLVTDFTQLGQPETYANTVPDARQQHFI